MNEKHLRFLDRLYSASRFFSRIIIWGGFLGIVVLLTATMEFPSGLILGIIVGGIFLLVSSLGMRKSLKDADKARAKLQAFAEGQKDALTPSKQQSYAIVGALATSFLGFVLLFSCLDSSCNADPTRMQLFFITIGTGAAIGFLFYEERVRGKSALIALLLLILVDVFFIGRVFSVW